MRVSWENLMRRRLARSTAESLDEAQVGAELAGAEVAPDSAPRSQETLEQAVERHLKAFVAAHKDGVPVRDLHERVMAEVERPLLRLALSATRGNQIKAASMLGLNRNTLRKLRELDLPVVRGIQLMAGPLVSGAQPWYGWRRAGGRATDRVPRPRQACCAGSRIRCWASSSPSACVLGALAMGIATFVVLADGSPFGTSRPGMVVALASAISR